MENGPKNSKEYKDSPRILAETPEWRVIDKPAGWLSVAPTSSVAGGPEVVVEWASREFSSEKPWIIHRLDVETSGVMLLARTAEAHRKANIWFEHREVKKQYECLCMGAPSFPTLRLDTAVGGSPAVTLVEVKERFARSFLAEARPLSGKRHQIRIHLAGKGLPILGDKKYGGPGALHVGAAGEGLKIGRVALHARRLTLPSGEAFESPWPEDFARWVAALRAEARAS